VIPSNDDASKSINKVLGFIVDAIAEGLSDRKATKDKTVEVVAEEKGK
jgi:small subunit ribosomal protein S2